MPECKHEIEIASCGVCTPRVAPDQPDLPHTWRPDSSWGTWLTARYDGICTGCDGPIEIGDQIRSSGARGWLCADCGDAYGGPRVVRVNRELL